MALLGTTPTQSSHSWTTEYAAEIKKVSPIVYRPLTDTMPTLRILLANAKPANNGAGYGTRKRSYHDIEHAVYSPHRGTEKQVFDLPDLDPLTQSEWTPKIWWNGAGTDDIELSTYGRENSLYDLAKGKMNALHLGNTLYLNYAIFSKHNESFTGGKLDIESIMSTAGRRIPYPITFQDITDESQMIASIPTLIRKASATGHTLGNIATSTTTNLFWSPKVTVPDGATITQNSTAGSNNYDTCTADNTVTVPLTIDILTEHLAEVQAGHQYKLYAPCGWKIYNFLRNQILAEQRRIADEYLKADLGINLSITMEEFNVVFYHEHMMDSLWPSTIFFFDPECLFLEYDPDFNPKVYEWQDIPKTNMQGTVIRYWHNLIRPDAQGVSAIHGVTDES